ncbi:LysR substrate-binding domain-containing protein [Sneathiella marina]|uniref:LysR substrate-binding domain-containing protein n=1 Tax=Sneathiella marina TaxID=2950108 RepID=A0ABY4WB25_9PROT|nr:LysR substrate-binding domain-containing protein [Sneathiella marina]USG62464.1 LysR substrate-binding domain-containing protein [Sneathiella marina]
MQPTLRQLLVFKTIVEQRSFGKSAKILNTSQPALSRAIKDLEAVLSRPLLIRTTRSVKPTEAGKEFYARAVRILDDLSEAVTVTRDVADGRKGRLVVSYMDFAIVGKLPEILKRIRNAQPKVQLDVRLLVTQVQIELLKQDKLDVGLVSGITEKTILSGFSRKLVDCESLVAVLPSDHHLANRKSLKMRELANEPFVTGGSHWYYYTDKLIDICRQHGFSPEITQTADMRDGIIGFVLAGIGITVYPQCITNAPRPGLSFVPINDVPKVINTFALWKTDNTNPTLPIFIEQLPQASTYSQ